MTAIYKGLPEHLTKNQEVCFAQTHHQQAEFGTNSRQNQDCGYKFLELLQAINVEINTKHQK